MSITRPEWDKQDDNNGKVDTALLNEVYFSTDDGYLWRIDDFIQVQGPTTTRLVGGKGTNPGHEETVYGSVLWNVILKRVGDEARARLGMVYDEFIVSPVYHRVKNAADKPKITYRGGGGKQVSTTPVVKFAGDDQMSDLGQYRNE